MFVWIRTNRKAFGLNFQMYMVLFCYIDDPAVCGSVIWILLNRYKQHKIFYTCCFSTVELGFPFLFNIAVKIKQIVLFFTVKPGFEWRIVKRFNILSYTLGTQNLLLLSPSHSHPEFQLMNKQTRLSHREHSCVKWNSY